MNVIKNHPLTSYFILACIFTWILALPLILTGLGLTSVNMNWHFLAAFGPTISALIVVYLAKGRLGLKELKERCLKWKVGVFWILFSAFIMPLFFILTILLNFLFTRTIIDLNSYMINNGLINIGSILLWIGVGAISYGIFEEIGWRGYALPKLQEKYNPLLATLILFLGWSVWHAPFFFYRFSITMIFGWLFGLFMGAILMTFIYNSSGGSALMAIIFHISNNIVWLFNIAEIQMYISIMMAILVVFILIIWRKTLSTKKIENSK
ncbi:MAG: CPBP family intramembrane glutamic endopeptidase [Candidatus Odinarchaeota archaeon]